MKMEKKIELEKSNSTKNTIVYAGDSVPALYVDKTTFGDRQPEQLEIIISWKKVIEND